VAETDKTELIVLNAGLDLPNANRAFYRVVAVDDRGQRSGPSDYAAAPRPFISSSPPGVARVGAEFRHQLSSIRSLGDLRLRIIDGKEVTGFWDVERPRFRLAKGPTWLKLDESAGVLHGVPDAAGEADVVLTVALERPVRQLDDSRLSWGHELVTETRTDIVGSAMRRFQLKIEK
jgi:hypothetical protein